jgi:hypothetical protein
MRLRTPLAALVLALLTLSAAPAAGKGPIEVEVHDERTGVTTVLNAIAPDLQELNGARALEELVGWPNLATRPKAASRGGLELIATLSWRYDENNPAWVDSIYTDRNGRTWVERRDQMSGTGAVTWGRVEAGQAFATVLAAIDGPDEVATTSVDAPSAEPASAAPAREEPERFDASSFGWGVGLTGLLAAGLVLAARLRQRSVTASRNSRVSSAALS